MVRRINIDDFERLYELGKRFDVLFEKHYHLENYVDDELYIINCYEDDGVIKGFIIANSLYENVEILLVYVDEAYRQKGIARTLICELENSDVENLFLEVSVENIPALKLYKKLGFEIINIRKKYYNGTDAYVMKKVLK